MQHYTVQRKTQKLQEKVLYIIFKNAQSYIKQNFQSNVVSDVGLLDRVDMDSISDSEPLNQKRDLAMLLFTPLDNCIDLSPALWGP